MNEIIWFRIPHGIRIQLVDVNMLIHGSGEQTWVETRNKTTHAQQQVSM